MLSTKNNGNPAAVIRAHYGELMGMTDLDEMKRRAVDLVGSSAIGKTNLRKFEAIVRKTSTVEGLQRYLTNFLMRADGEGVVEKRQGTHDHTRRFFR